MRGPIRRSPWGFVGSLALLASVGCNNQGTDQAPSPDQGPAMPGQPAMQAGAGATVTEGTPLTDAEKIRAGKLAQRLVTASHGPVEISKIEMVSGVVRVVATPAIEGGKPFDVFLSRDLRLVFPTADDANERLKAVEKAPQFDACLRASGLRLYGDPKQAETQRQLRELGGAGRFLLVDCASHPTDCAVLGQTTLPVLTHGMQRIASFMPRKVIGEWTKCSQP